MTDTSVQPEAGAGPPPPPDFPPAPRRLYRRPGQRMIGGVCAGLADYFGLDPTVVRLAVVLLALAGPGVPAYLIAWIVVPAAPPGAPPAAVHRGPTFPQDGRTLAGAVLLVLAAVIVFDGWFSPWPDFGFPLLLIGGGAWLLLRRRDDPPASPAPAWPSPASAHGPAEATADPPTHAWIPPSPVGPRPPRSFLGLVVLGVGAVGAGVLWLLDVTGATDVGLEVVLALALLAVGVGLAVGTFYGRALWLIGVGLVLVALLSAVSAVDVPLQGGVGERAYDPTTVADVRDDYELLAGEMILDLSGVDFDGETVTVTASVGMGSLVVVAPDGVALDVDAHAGLGEIRVPGNAGTEVADGVDVGQSTLLDGRRGAGRLELDLRVGLGEVEVRHA